MRDNIKELNEARISSEKVFYITKYSNFVCVIFDDNKRTCLVSSEMYEYTIFGGLG